MTPEEYQSYVKKISPKSPIVKDTIFAFLIGGGIFRGVMPCAGCSDIEKPSAFSARAMIRTV